MIIVCCKGDKELEKFPVLGQENQTKHYTPSEEITTMGIHYSAKMLQYTYANKRHENLTLSLYLPDDCQLSLSQEEYVQKNISHDPEWCHEKSKTPYFGGQCPSVIRR